METIWTIRCRSVELYLATITGRIYLWLKSEWRPSAILLTVIAIAVSAAEYFINRHHLPAEIWLKPEIWIQGLWHIWWKVLALFVLTMVIGWAWQARKRIVVEPFADFIDGGSAAKGLSTLLMVNISRLRELYSIVDEQRAISTEVGENRPIDTTIKVEDVSQFLQNAVSTESELSIGPLKIPANALIATAGRILQGPRILGSIYKDNNRLIMAGHFTGGHNSGVWQIDDPVPLGEPAEKPRSADNMVLELAYRIFTDLALNGTVRWRATYSFCEGLRKYRDCLRTPVDRKLKLRQAEKYFIDALALDEKMYHAYHNIAVVYTELGQERAAESAFFKAIEHNPESWASYYGLALNFYERGRYNDAIQLCDHIINAETFAVEDHDLATAYDLKGLAERLLDPGDVGYLDQAIESRSLAVIHAWNALCRAEFGRRNTARMVEIACYCLGDLAVAYAYKADTCSGKLRDRNYRKAEALLRQALKLAPSNYELHYQLGRIYLGWTKYDRSVAELKSAIQINPGNIDCRAVLAQAFAYNGDKKYSKDVCEYVLDNASRASADALDSIKETYARLGENSLAENIARKVEILKPGEGCQGSGLSALPDLNAKLGKSEQESRWWDYAMTSLELGRLCLDGGKTDEAQQYVEGALQKYDVMGNPAWESSRVAVGAGLLFSDLGLHGRAEKCYRTAIDRLQGRYPQEIRSQGLKTLLARALRKQDRYFEALQQAEEALSCNPLESYEQDEVGKIYYALNDYEKARDIWESALIWSPDNPDLHEKIGNCYRHLAQGQKDAPGRREMLRNAASHLEQAMALYPNDRIEELVRILYWLGHLYFKLGDPVKTISNFTLVQSYGLARLNATLGLGEVYLWNKSYSDSEKQLWQLIREAEELIRNGSKVDQLIGAGTGEKLYLSEAIAWAYFFIALSCAEQVINLERALDLIGRALTYVEQVPDENIKKKLRLICKSGTGWIYYKQGKIDEAIGILNQVLTIQQDVETYLRLAKIYAYKALIAENKQEGEQLVLKAVSFCMQAKNMDKFDEYSREITDLQLCLKQDTGKNQSQKPNA